MADAPPSARPVDVALRDGSTVRVRAVQADDLDGLRELLAGMSDDSRWMRFLTVGVDLERAARFAADPGDGAGLVATAGTTERIVAHALFVRGRSGSAEVAFEVADDWRGRGIATILLAHLAEVAQAGGVTRFTAYIHPTNRRMIGVFRASGFPVEVHASPGELTIEMPAALGETARARFEDRTRVAAAAAVARVLRPSSIAIVGVGSSSASLGRAVVRNLLAGRYNGMLYVVDPEVAAADGVSTHPSVHALPRQIDLGVLAGATDTVASLADACGDAGMHALLVLSAGFADAGPDGRRRLAELLAICRRHGMRLVGPRSLGVINTDPALRLNATRLTVPPRAGPVAMASQSAAIGVAAISEAARRGVGFSSFVSTGDKADLSGNDFLQYWEDDPATQVVLLYLESFGNPRRFGAIARRLGSSKPIVALKSGRRAVTADPSLTGTRALVGASELTIDALFEHAGVIRTDSLAEQFDVAAVLASQPLPRGGRVGIVTNARGPALGCADACAAAGLRITPTVDLGAEATPVEYSVAIEATVAGADALIAIFAPPETEAKWTAAALREAVEPAAEIGIPLLGVFMAQSDEELAALTSELLVPTFRSPEEAARALVRVSRYAMWRARPADDAPELARVDADAAAAVIAGALAHGPCWLRQGETDALLDSYGVPRGSGVGTVVAEMVAGVLADPDFGPVVACGHAGREAELFGDVALRIAPLGRREARELVRSLRSFPLLDGYRGAPKANVGALEDLLVRVAALAAAHAEVAEIDCDPVVIGSEGAVIVDARIRVRSPAAARPFPALDR